VAKKAKKKIEGIGGWLILPTIGLFFSGLVWVLSFFIWGFLVIKEFSLYNLTFFLISIILGFLTIYTLILEFKKKKEFPQWVIITLVAGVVATLILSVFDGQYSDLISSIAGAAIWIWYFSVSVRVKNTFVK
jgi:hypothetical protein